MTDTGGIGSKGGLIDGRRRRSAQPQESSEDVPVVVFDRSGGAWVFRDYRDAANWMEAVDVVDGEYHAFDRDGYVLSLSAVGDDVLVRRTGECAYAEAVDQLRATLSNSPISLPVGTLEEMIEQLLNLNKALGLKGRLSATLKRLGSARRPDRDRFRL